MRVGARRILGPGGMASNTLTNGRLAYWALSDTTDSSGNGRNTTAVNGGPGFVTGQVGNAADFDRTLAQYLRSSDTAFRFTDNDSFTLACWCKIRSWPGADNPLLDRLNAPAASGYALQGRVTDNKFTMTVQNTTICDAQWSSVASTGVWYFVLGYHDAARAKIGISVDNGTRIEVDRTVSFPASTLNFCVGAENDPAGGGVVFDGQIDEAGVWSRVLSVGEQAIYYQRTSAGLSPF